MIKNIFKSSTANEIRLSKRGDRHNIFHIQRFKNDHGFYVYALENSAEGRKIFIPRFVFGRFRATIRTLLKQELNKPKAQPFETGVSFLDRDYFFFKSSRMDLDHLIIQDIDEGKGSSGYITVSRRCLPKLDMLLYNEALQHPNDVLEGIISYHKLFQFSFVKGSKSFTSDLALRKDVLQQTIPYRPRLAEKDRANIDNKVPSKKSPASNTEIRSSKENKKSKVLYKSKLGERFHEKNIQVDYEQVFGDKNISLSTDATTEDDKKNSKSKSILSQFLVPLSALDIKAFKSEQFSFELSTQRASEFRERFINDRSCEFYLGIEIVDALFTYNRVLKTFQFPLYYVKVKIRESGRKVTIKVRQDGRIYLNHLALANLVDKFSESKSASENIDKFFKTLIAQDISIDSLNDRIHMVRHLPVKDDIFDRTRDVLLGYQDENGKGGILGDLKLKGMECDLHSVHLYRSPSILSPVDQALEHDLDTIDTIAHSEMTRFYESLLGRFLTPELQCNDSQNSDSQDSQLQYKERLNKKLEKSKFAPTTWIPRNLPQSSRSLVDRLNHHDLVLLEGPPGTGKTYTIMNLLIHCICSKKRVLIVSDQQAAIEALVEKLQDYLIGDERGSASERHWNELLFSAIKVVDDLPNIDKDLPEVISQLSSAFKVQDPGSVSKQKSAIIEKKFKKIKTQIMQLTECIAEKMHQHVGEGIDFEYQQPDRKEDSGNIAALLELLGILLGNNKADRRLVDTFFQNRQILSKNNMLDCFSYFKIPSRDFENEISSLKQDEKLLTLLLEKKINSHNDFLAQVQNYPRHELLRYMESIILSIDAAATKKVQRVKQKIQSIFYSSFLKEVRLLLSMVQDQISLLKRSQHWSHELWHLLSETHECIRLRERPNRAFSLYQAIFRKNQSDVKQSGHSIQRLSRQGHSIQSHSIQGYLEQIDDLYQQHDRLIKDKVITSLRQVAHDATTSQHNGGTDAITSIMALVDNLKQFSSVAESGSVFDELKQKLYETFPIWLVRKQTVPLLLPCTEKSFDLVIVDEATQCRVDDAMSLLFRGRKMLVVGDDKQTVLQKNSIIDDYLFKDHELDEQLRSTQARGFKGGGSHIFALVKSIKQASVMLDEHYRCPADIVQFSNQYVYDNELKIMQWRLPEQSSPVEIDDSEREVENSKKPTSGKFKGIETGMIDRYMDYVYRTIKKIEKDTGRQINMETDVALCYFLLKNEPYVKAVKQQLLTELKGDDVLDGAGAALQGKERDYIFYFWDITRYNIGAFKQGDDADKRKGELNVLMSRPKKKSFHFLHRNFEQLDSSRTNITHYLWRALIEQRTRTPFVKKRYNKNSSADSKDPGHQSLLKSLLTFTLDNSAKRSINGLYSSLQSAGIEFRNDIVVGDARRAVDLIAFIQQKAVGQNTLGFVDLASFSAEDNLGQVIVDYFFQLKRAVPKIDPVFLFPYELADENSQTFRSLIYKLEKFAG